MTNDKPINDLMGEDWLNLYMGLVTMHKPLCILLRKCEMKLMMWAALGAALALSACASKPVMPEKLQQAERLAHTDEQVQTVEAAKKATAQANRAENRAQKQEARADRAQKKADRAAKRAERKAKRAERAAKRAESRAQKAAKRAEKKAQKMQQVDGVIQQNSQ